MIDGILRPDVELFLTSFVRTEISDAELLAKYPVMQGFEVANEEPDVDSQYFPDKLIVIRDDGTAARDILLGDTAIGVNVFITSPDLEDPSLAARIVNTIIQSSARVQAGNPVANVAESNGPYTVIESQPRSRWYSTHTIATVGASL